MDQAELYGVKVRRDRDEVCNWSAAPPLRQYRDIGDEEAVAELLHGRRSVDVTAIHLRYRQDLDAYPGSPAAGIFAAVHVRTLTDGEPDGVSQAAVVTWPAAGSLEMYSLETRAMQAVMAKAAQLAEAANFALRVAWYADRTPVDRRVRDHRGDGRTAAHRP
jgi:hypothetical protein